MSTTLKIATQAAHFDKAKRKAEQDSRDSNFRHIVLCAHCAHEK